MALAIVVIAASRWIRHRLIRCSLLMLFCAACSVALCYCQVEHLLVPARSGSGNRLTGQMQGFRCRHALHPGSRWSASEDSIAKIICVRKDYLHISKNICYSASMSTFEKLVKHFGSAAAIAEHYGVKYETVRLWKHNGLPAIRALDFERDTKGKVTIREVLESSRQAA